ncbi:MAG: PHP domain-containing protein, partial [Gammaproteobacteria bacterium]|nr:PHP domain-containing protein [Gammaproteobacteria bacterium]
MTTFVHLRVHTEYSLVDSVIRVPELIAATAAVKMPAIALTDEHNLFAMVKFYREALQKGVKPLIGVDLCIAEPGERSTPSRLTLLCMNPTGYGNLTRLVSRAYLEGQQKGAPMVDRAWLIPETTSGLIALSGGAFGDVGRCLQSRRPAEAERALAFWQARFEPDRYYLELTRVGRPDEEALIEATLAFAAQHALPVVATNDVRFLAPGDFESHEARVCIHDGTLLADPSRLRKYTPQQYLRSPAEMVELFADIPEAIENSVEIARRCSLPLRLGESMLPRYPVPEGQTTEEFLRR